VLKFAAGVPLTTLRAVQENIVSTKIGGFDSGRVQVGTGRSVKRTSDSSNSSSSAATGSTSDTHITDSARKLAELEQTVQALPAINEGRVAEVSSSIQNGSYKIDSGRIADKLLQSEQDLSKLV